MLHGQTRTGCNPGRPITRRGPARVPPISSLEEDLPAKSSQFGTCRPTWEDSNSSAWKINFSLRSAVLTRRRKTATDASPVNQPGSSS